MLVPYWKMRDFVFVLLGPGSLRLFWGSEASRGVKKSEPKDSIRPRWGKKTASLFCPPKKSFVSRAKAGSLLELVRRFGQVPKTEAVWSSAQMRNDGTVLVKCPAENFDGKMPCKVRIS